MISEFTRIRILHWLLPTMWIWTKIKGGIDDAQVVQKGEVLMVRPLRIGRTSGPVRITWRFLRVNHIYYGSIRNSKLSAAIRLCTDQNQA